MVISIKKAEVSNFIKIALVILFIILVILIGFFIFNRPSQNNNNNDTENIVQNPLSSIISANTRDGSTNEAEVIKEGVLKFNETYINFLLTAMEVSDLHKSNLGYGNPKLEMLLDSEVWNSELGNYYITNKGNCDDPDIRIKMKKEDAVRALLSSDIKQFMKNSVSTGKVQIEMVAGKVELLSKGYLEMSKNLGYEVKI